MSEAKCRWCKPPGSGIDTCELWGKCMSCGGTGISEHSTHGRGEPEDGPHESDCGCRDTSHEEECSEAGCGFCFASLCIKGLK